MARAVLKLIEGEESHPGMVPRLGATLADVLAGSPYMKLVLAGQALVLVDGKAVRVKKPEDLERIRLDEHSSIVVIRLFEGG